MGVIQIKGNCLIAQSGGPTSVINNSLLGIIEHALQWNSIGNIYGAVNGLVGILNETYIDFRTLSNNKLMSLRNTPGAALGTCRYKISDQEIEKVIEIFSKMNIRYFFYIGGNGSMQVANMIYEKALEKKFDLIVMGVPKSIDNDLMHTDHSPGYGSSAKFLATCILDIAMDHKSFMHSHRVTIIETMGRNAGWLAGSCALASKIDNDIPLLIYLPESAFSLEKFLCDVTRTYQQYGYCLAVVSEGVRDEAARLIAVENKKDALGRDQLGGVSSYLTQVIEEQTTYSARYLLPSIWQRSGMMISSKVDVEEAYEVGKRAFEFAKKEHSGMMVNLIRSKPLSAYEIDYGMVQLRKVAQTEKRVPAEWYDKTQSTMSDKFIEYVEPLIQGEIFVPMKNGLPYYQMLTAH